MPEATVNKHNYVVLRKNDIRSTWQPTAAQSVAQAPGMKPLADKELKPSI